MSTIIVRWYVTLSYKILIFQLVKEIQKILAGVCLGGAGKRKPNQHTLARGWSLHGSQGCATVAVLADEAGCVQAAPLAVARS
jgi:hypothetical protein